MWERAQRYLWDIYERYYAAEVPYYSAALSYYALFSLFPLLLLVVALGGYVLGGDSKLEQALLDYIYSFLPSRDLQLAIKSNLQAVIESRSPLTIVGAATLVWSASGIFQGLQVAFNKAWGISTPRLWWQSILVAFGTMLLMAVLVASYLLTSAWMVASGTRVLDWLLPRVQPWLPYDLSVANAHLITWWTILGAILLNALVVGMLLKWLPNARVETRDVIAPALLVSLLEEGVKHLFAWYSTSFAKFELVYGSIGVLIGLLFWGYIAAIILLMGAVLAAVNARGRAFAGDEVEAVTQAAHDRLLDATRETEKVRSEERQHQEALHHHDPDLPPLAGQPGSR